MLICWALIQPLFVHKSLQTLGMHSHSSGGYKHDITVA